jgi:hypothetical protein
MFEMNFDSYSREQVCFLTHTSEATEEFSARPFTLKTFTSEEDLNLEDPRRPEVSKSTAELLSNTAREVVTHKDSPVYLRDTNGRVLGTTERREYSKGTSVSTEGRVCFRHNGLIGPTTAFVAIHSRHPSWGPMDDGADMVLFELVKR